jgi:hypothetical protein
MAIEIDALIVAGFMEAEAHRCHDFIERKRPQISAWLNTTMSMSERRNSSPRSVVDRSHLIETRPVGKALVG